MRIGAETEPGERLNADLWVTDLGTGEVNALLEVGRAGAFAPAPNGS